MPEKTFHSILIKPRSLFHLGEGGAGVKGLTPYPHSDTLFSAFCHAYLQIFGREKLEELLNEFKSGEPPFLMSSAFPLIDADSRIYFFPKPHIAVNVEVSEGFWDAWKMTSYFSKSVFENLLANGLEGVRRAFDDGKIRLKDGIMIAENELQPVGEERVLYKVVQLPRNVIKRVTKPKTQSTMIYYVGATAYKDAGMHILLDAKQDYLGEIKAAFNLLRDDGVGGKRALGYGSFDFSMEKLSLIEAGGSEALVTLSLFYPTEEEVKRFMQKPHLLGYRLLSRGGYASSPSIRGGKLKRTVRMMVEGSVFPKIEGRSLYGGFIKVLGRGEDVPHEVYRYGYALPLSIKV
jgi:CRISPR-associated protein Csm4